MLKDSQLDLCGRVDFARTTPLLARDEAFSFACAGCGGCCRGREDIVLSGFDLWRIAGRLRLPPQTVARAFCRASIAEGVSSKPKWRTIWPATTSLPGKRPTSAGRRPAWTWKTWWSRWTPPSSRPCAAGCRRSSGRHSILSLTMRKSTSRSWKKTSSGWAQSCKN